MKKLELIETISICANVGVILGIVFLALELHQNNELLESQANMQLLDNRLQGVNQIISIDLLGEAILKSSAGQPLTDLELLKLDNYAYATFSKWEWEHRQFTLGFIDAGNLPVNDWRAVYLMYPRFGELWQDETFRVRFSEPFVKFIDENVVPR
jgi:hypothetical protein